MYTGVLGLVVLLWLTGGTFVLSEGTRGNRPCVEMAESRLEECCEPWRDMSSCEWLETSEERCEEERMKGWGTTCPVMLARW